MTSPFARIESHPHEAKRLIGINYDQFLALVALALALAYRETGRSLKK